MRRKKTSSGMTATGKTVDEFISSTKSKEAYPTTDHSDHSDSKYSLNIAWGSVVRDTLRISNPLELVKKLKAELRLSKEELNSYENILNAVNNSAKNYNDSYMLYRASRCEDQQFSAKIRERIDVLKKEAINELMREYSAKKRKSPTIDDIEDRIISNWPDEYLRLRKQESELHGASKSLEALSKAWFSRCQDLRKILDAFLKSKEGR
jgi:hypothetical protein